MKQVNSRVKQAELVLTSVSIAMERKMEIIIHRWIRKDWLAKTYGRGKWTASQKDRTRVKKWSRPQKEQHSTERERLPKELSKYPNNITNSTPKCLCVGAFEVFHHKSSVVRSSTLSRRYKGLNIEAVIPIPV